MNLADRVIEAFDNQRLIDPLTDGDPTLDEDGAYAVAFEVRARRVARDEHVVGRKIGFTNSGIWDAYGIYAPIWGDVYDSTLHMAPDSDARVAIDQFVQPHIEPEIQLHFATAPPVSTDEFEILACVDWIAHGFELVQCPFPGWKFQAPDCIAACGLHAALVVGRQVPVADIDDCVAKLRAFTMTLSRDGEEVAAGAGANVLETPLLAFAHLADVLDRQSRFEPVQAGEIITTGTLTPAFPVAAGQTWTTTIDGIELPGMSLSLT
jgi:2-keto-4-pentenoate hydratase